MFPSSFTPHSPQTQAQISSYSPQNQPWHTQSNTAVMAPFSSPVPSSQQQYQPHYHHNHPNHPQSDLHSQQGLNFHEQYYRQEQQHHHHHQSHPLYPQQQHHHILSQQHYQHNTPLQCVLHPYGQPVLITPESREGSYSAQEFLSPQQGMNAPSPSPSPSSQDTPSSDHVGFIPQLSTPSMAHVPAGTLPWSTTADFDAKDLFDPLAEALCLDPMVINPAQLCAPPRVHVLDGGDVDGRSNNGMYMYSHGRGYDDNDSVDGTDDDVDARRHLSDSSYLSSTPPLSPNILDHHQHSHLVQTLAGLSTSSPLRGSVSSFAHAFELFSNGPSAAHQRSDSQDRCQDDEDEHDEIYEEDNEEKYQQQQQNQQKDQEEAEERQFECQQCHKRFLRQYNLNAHLKTHSSERLHNCNQCDKSFLRPYDLSRHQRIHSKDKPYSCVICGLIFIRNDAIWRHYRKLHQNHPDVPISRRDKSKQKSASTTVPSKPRASAN